MRLLAFCRIAIVALSPAMARAQSATTLTIHDNDLPAPRLWEPYSFQLHAGGGIEPYKWQFAGGDLPQALVLDNRGELHGDPSDSFDSEISIVVTDSSRPAKHGGKDFVLKTAAPLTADWTQRAQVNGRRIEGGIKISNQTGRDFDVTVIVLAIDDINRATAIGYQHFSLKRDTTDQEIPFGENLSRGNYAVNADVVGEEAISGRIFRARLMAEKLAVTQGP
jgi:hypothetical protein